MYQTPEHFAAANKSAVHALVEGANAALASAERISTLNLSAARAALDDLSSSSALLGSTDATEAAALQSALVQPSFERAVSYSRSVCEIAAETRQQLAQQVEAQFDDFQKQLAEMIEQAARSAPVGSDAAVSAFKTVFAAANSALDSFNTAARQVAEVTERSVAAAADASVAAVGQAVDAGERD